MIADGDRTQTNESELEKARTLTGKSDLNAKLIMFPYNLESELKKCCPKMKLEDLSKPRQYARQMRHLTPEILKSASMTDVVNELVSEFHTFAPAKQTTKNTTK